MTVQRRDGGPVLAQFAIPFIGRERELGELARLLRTQRQVTPTGPGGIGNPASTDLASGRPMP